MRWVNKIVEKVRKSRAFHTVAWNHVLIVVCLCLSAIRLEAAQTGEYSDADRERIVVEALRIQRCAVFAKYDSAMFYIVQMLDQYKDFDFAKGIIYMKWSNLERVRGNKAAAIEKGWEAIGYAKQDTSIKLRFHLSLLMAGLYMEQGPPDSCKFYAEAALDVIDRIASPDPDLNKASCYQFLADAEKKSKNYQMAKRYLAFCQKVYDHPNYISYLPMTLLNLAIVKLEENPNVNVEPELKRALWIADSAGIFSHQTTLLHFLVTYHSERKQFEPAFSYQQRLVSLEDSANVAAKEQTVKDLETKYKTEQKDAENQYLKQINDSKTRENAQLQVFNLVVGIALGVAVLLLTLLFLSRRKVSRQKLELERLSLLNQRIFAVISHDFKGPLIALQSMLELMETDILDAQSKAEFTADMKQQILQTTLMLENLLSWARTELHLQVGVGTTANAAMVAEEVRLQLANAAAAKRISVIIDVPKETLVAIPKDILTILLRNLLSNGIKFSPVGGQVKVVLDSKTGEIAVIDSGTGIEATKLDSIFKGAVQSSYGTHSETGFGLGLYIVSTLVRKFGGNVTGMNNAGGGATFRLILPMSKS